MLSSYPGLPHVQSVREIQIPESRKFMLFGSGILDLGIWLQESRKPLMIEIQNPSSTEKNWNPRLSSLDSLYTRETRKLHILAENNFFQFYGEKWICGICICLLTKLHWMTTTLFKRVNVQKKGCRSCTSNSFPGHSKCTTLHFSGHLKLNFSQGGLQPVPMEGG